jgi:hypothetical protein
VEVDVPLSQQGVDSLVAVELRNWLGSVIHTHPRYITIYAVIKPLRAVTMRAKSATDPDCKIPCSRCGGGGRCALVAAGSGLAGGGGVAQLAGQ